MKYFSKKDKFFIMKNQDRITLGDLAKKFCCDWKEIYEVYGEILSTEEYIAFINLRKPQRGRPREGEEYERFSRTKIIGDEEGFDYNFFDKCYSICGYRCVPAHRCKMYWK